MARQTLAGQNLVIFVIHLDTPPSAQTLWTIDQPDADVTTHNTYKRQTSILPAGFEPATPASEWPQTHALDRAATRIGIKAT